MGILGDLVAGVYAASTRRIRLTFFSVVFVSLLIPFPSDGAGVVILDLDDTVFSSGEVHGGSFGTKRVLVRIENRGQTIVPYPANLPSTIEISPGKYRYLRDRNLLGLGETMIGSLSAATGDNGERIYPGYYWLDPTRSYERFREGPPGQNFLLEDFKVAEKIDKKKTWRGPMWDLMVKVLSTAETAKTLMILTARGHSPEEWMEFFGYLHKKKYIKFLPEKENLIGVSRPEHHYLSPAGDPFEAKYNKIYEIANHLAQVPPDPVSDLRQHPWGKKSEDLAINTLVFAEDNQPCATAVRDLMIALVRGGRHPLKFVLINTGLESHFRETKAVFQPREAVIQPDGTFRKATLVEQMGLAEDCAHLIGK